MSTLLPTQTPSVASPRQSTQGNRDGSILGNPETEPLSRYARGYPSLSATMNSDPCLAMFRRFGRIRMRTLLNKQDQLAELERRLYVLDLREENQLNLSSRRHDDNAERKTILEDIEIALKDYDQALFNCNKILELPTATMANIGQLSQWIKDSQPLEEQEQRFLEDHEDIVALTEDLFEQSTILKIVGLLAKKYRPADSDPRNYLSSNQRMYYISDKFVRNAEALKAPAVRFTVTITAAVLLLVPIVILCFIKNLRGQVFIIVAFTLVFSVVVASTRATSVEIYGATAAYVAVMSVFLGSVVSSPTLP